MRKSDGHLITWRNVFLAQAAPQSTPSNQVGAIHESPPLSGRAPQNAEMRISLSLDPFGGPTMPCFSIVSTSRAARL